MTVLAKHIKTKQKYVIDGSIFKLLPDDLFQVALEKLSFMIGAYFSDIIFCFSDLVKLLKTKS